ncbi:hypothetical protein CFC21_057559 [Triticum aestivum]|uniref:C2H2-type domain-containing protein n=2 Tax=Triticum aestivum TaxID=4565 RepID=A0A9R1KCG3_WHEAT|nr:hypothetical protein CFC21_057559 [Triticum aestivum]
MTMDVASGDTRSPIKSIELLLKLSSPASSSRVIGKNKRVQLQAAGGTYECRTCGRRFVTFQALGGHRTSHKRPRVRAHSLDLLLGARPGKARARCSCTAAARAARRSPRGRRSAGTCAATGWHWPRRRGWRRPRRRRPRACLCLVSIVRRERKIWWNSCCIA